MRSRQSSKRRNLQGKQGILSLMILKFRVINVLPGVSFSSVYFLRMSVTEWGPFLSQVLPFEADRFEG